MFYFCFFLYYLFHLGIEEDFTSWKNGFVQDIFPVLCGERPLSSVGDEKPSSLCGCGREPKQDCCQATKTTTTQPQSQEDDVSY